MEGHALKDCNAERAWVRRVAVLGEEGDGSFPNFDGVLRTQRTVSDRFVHVCRYLRPIMRSKNMSAHTSLTGMTG